MTRHLRAPKLVRQSSNSSSKLKGHPSNDFSLETILYVFQLLKSFLCMLRENLISVQCKFESENEHLEHSKTLASSGPYHLSLLSVRPRRREQRGLCLKRKEPNSAFGLCRAKSSLTQKNGN